MSDKINEQTEKMREMAQTTLDKAKDAVSKYMTESQKLREKADTSVRGNPLLNAFSRDQLDSEALWSSSKLFLVGRRKYDHCV